MKRDRLYDILETMKKNQFEAILSHFGALSDHSVAAPEAVASEAVAASSSSTGLYDFFPTARAAFTGRCVLSTYFFNSKHRQTNGPTGLPSYRNAFLSFCDVSGPP